MTDTKMQELSDTDLDAAAGGATGRVPTPVTGPNNAPPTNGSSVPNPTTGNGSAPNQP